MFVVAEVSDSCGGDFGRVISKVAIKVNNKKMLMLYKLNRSDSLSKLILQLHIS